MGYSCSLGLSGGLTIPHHKETAYYKMLHRALEQPRQRKMDMKFGTWNVRSLYTAGSLKTDASKLVIG
jgi:hypothetical protein